MTGLTTAGFEPDSYEPILQRITAKLNTISPGIDLDPSSPDGNLARIFSFELAQLWSQLGLVYNSYNPNLAVGSGLRNLGLISGLQYGVATRSQAFVDLVGTEDTVVPKGSIVADDDGNEFVTQLDATIPSSVLVYASLPGPIPILAGTLTTIKSPVTGWDSITQSIDGTKGSPPQSETSYRNSRNKTVLRNYTSVSDVVRARLLELGIEQVEIINNTSPTETADDGTPPQTVHITVGELPTSVTDEQIARVILVTTGLGTATYGSTTVTIDDSQGTPQTVSFSKAVGVDIFIDVDVTFLTLDYAGAEEQIKTALIDHINSLAADEDVYWSRLFQFITPFGKAEVNSLTIGKSASTLSTNNIEILSNEFARTDTGSINLVVTQ